MDSEPPLASRYDVIIVGGRPAGASLAARLAAHEIPTLVIDRARFPSLPAVPSCAVLYPPAMALMDELGIDQDDFGDDTARTRRLVMDVDGQFEACFDMIETEGRDYIYGIDRARFDFALWENLRRHPSVTAHEGISFLDVIRDETNAVVGVKAKTPDGSIRSIEAGCVVGADGRFSSVARKVGAEVREDFTRTSSAHFATWEGVARHDDDERTTIHLYTTARGLDVLFFPISGNRVQICTHCRTDHVHRMGSVEEFYQRTIRSFPQVEQRLERATQLSRVSGLKRIANRYRDTGGAGWVLVGDALHHKDPVDGQGIYDALIESKFLAEELTAWHAGKQTFERALAGYDRRVMEETHPMFIATTQRLERELYDKHSPIVLKTVMRWVLNDAQYKRRFMQYLCRATPPDTWLTPSLMAGAIGRGMLGDLRRVLRRARGS